jgi:hypothetical protein
MSSPVLSEAKEDKSVTLAKQGKVRQKLQPGRNRDAWKQSPWKTSSSLLAIRVDASEKARRCDGCKQSSKPRPASTTRRRGQRRTAMATPNREFELVGEELYFTNKEIMDLEQKWTSGVNDLAQRDILDDNDARNVVVDLLREIRKLRYMLKSERTKNVPGN